MKSTADTLIDSLQSLAELKEKVVNTLPRGRIYSSSFSGSSRSLFIKSISGMEKQIVVLCPTVQSVNETKVELSILDMGEIVIAADDLSVETLQERLTDINKRV